MFLLGLYKVVMYNQRSVYEREVITLDKAAKSTRCFVWLEIWSTRSKHSKQTNHFRLRLTSSFHAPRGKIIKPQTYICPLKIAKWKLTNQSRSTGQGENPWHRQGHTTDVKWPKTSFVIVSGAAGSDGRRLCQCIWLGVNSRLTIYSKSASRSHGPLFPVPCVPYKVGIWIKLYSSDWETHLPYKW